MKPKKSSRKKLWTRIGIIAAIVIVLALLFNNVSGSTQPIKDAADQFKVPAEWTLTTERVEPPRFFCLRDVGCPSLHRNWSTPHAITRAELEAILHRSNLSFSIDSNCEIDRDASGSVPLCTASGKIKNFNAQITIWQDSGSNAAHQLVINMD